MISKALEKACERMKSIYDAKKLENYLNSLSWYQESITAIIGGRGMLDAFFSERDKTRIRAVRHPLHRA